MRARCEGEPKEAVAGVEERMGELVGARTKKEVWAHRGSVAWRIGLPVLIAGFSLLTALITVAYAQVAGLSTEFPDALLFLILAPGLAGLALVVAGGCVDAFASHGLDGIEGEIQELWLRHTRLLARIEDE